MSGRNPISLQGMILDNLVEQVFLGFLGFIPETEPRQTILRPGYLFPELGPLISPHGEKDLHLQRLVRGKGNAVHHQASKGHCLRFRGFSYCLICLSLQGCRCCMDRFGIAFYHDSFDLLGCLGGIDTG